MKANYTDLVPPLSMCQTDLEVLRQLEVLRIRSQTAFHDWTQRTSWRTSWSNNHFHTEFTLHAW
jgi:hypothetical protein